MHRGFVGGGRGLGGGLAPCLLLGNRRRPGPIRAAEDAASFRQLLQHGAGIGHDPDVRTPIPADPGALGVDMDDPGLERHLGSEAGPEVPVDAERDDEIRPPEGVTTGAVAEQRMPVIQGAASQAVEEHGRIGGFGYRREGIGPSVGPTPPEAGPTEDDGLLGACQHRGDLVDGVGVGGGGTVRPVPAGPGDGGLLDHLRLHIPRDVEEHRASAASEGVAGRRGDVLGQATRVGGRRRPPGDRLEQARVVHLL